jgi:carbamoyltransferase
MTITCDCSEEMTRQSPAVVHLDGTARPQLIRRDIDAFYYDVLKAYHRRTGVPSLINTSFNMHEEPIVCTPDDAVRAFVRGHLDCLVLGPFLVDAVSGEAAR